jgi:hypothetical protein
MEIQVFSGKNGMKSIPRFHLPYTLNEKNLYSFRRGQNLSLENAGNRSTVIIAHSHLIHFITITDGISRKSFK